MQLWAVSCTMPQTPHLVGLGPVSLLNLPATLNARQRFFQYSSMTQLASSAGRMGGTFTFAKFNSDAPKEVNVPTFGLTPRVLRN